jgi:hypothetical protein
VAEQETFTRELRRIKDIEAEQALIKHHKRQIASHQQAVEEAEARLAVLMRPTVSMDVAAAPDEPTEPKPREPAEPAAKPEPEPDEPVAAAIVRAAKDLYPTGTGTAPRKEIVAVIEARLATEALAAGKPPPGELSRDRVGRALKWRKG